MTGFMDDLSRAFQYAKIISKERAEAWGTNVSGLVDWQEQAFTVLLAGGETSDINRAWVALRQDEATRPAAELLHVELQAVLTFQQPLVEQPSRHKQPSAGPATRRRPLRKAMQILKTLLQSLKEVFGDLLGIRGKALLQVAIEAAEAFA
ncbi:MAG: hypothetical protein WBG85_10130 [Rhodanobacter sp.]